MCNPPTPVARGLKRPLLPVPDSLPACQMRCHDLMEEIWRLDRRWAQLKADLFDADRQGHAVDTASFIREMELHE